MSELIPARRRTLAGGFSTPAKSSLQSACSFGGCESLAHSFCKFRAHSSNCNFDQSKQFKVPRAASRRALGTEACTARTGAAPTWRSSRRRQSWCSRSRRCSRTRTETRPPRTGRSATPDAKQSLDELLRQICLCTFLYQTRNPLRVMELNQNAPDGKSLLLVSKRTFLLSNLTYLSSLISAKS